ncbi:hypothetical protein BDB01DRAFT_810126 [Pilobolus umbonatus]|nr:hypothetical protein BDB01DRAFT_810126 [Pilobolus umbonatus]
MVTRCTGNDFIMSFALRENEVPFIIVHENDTKCSDNQESKSLGTSCIINNDSEIILMNYTYHIMNDELYSTVDDTTTYFIPCIVKEFSRVCQITESRRSKKDSVIEKAFWVYLKSVIVDKMSTSEAIAYDPNSLVHLTMTVPDNWNTDIINTIKRQLNKTEIRGIDQISIVHQSDALISYLQLPHFGYSLSDGDYCIVCHFTEFHKASVYAYEMGPLIKGLNQITTYKLRSKEIFHVDYLKKDFLMTVLFGWNNKEAVKYNVDIDKLIELCYGDYWDLVIRTYKSISI